MCPGFIKKDMEGGGISGTKWSFGYDENASTDDTSRAV